jgi:predicted esterase
VSDLAALGPPPSKARATIVLAHGRGATAADILGVATALGLDDVAWLAPQAPGNTWYPYSFLVPMERNEPSLSRSLATLGEIVDGLEAQKIPASRIGFLGFSQGACLSLEFAARHARRYAAVIAFSGGLIGPPGTPRDYTGSFEGTPMFLGCSDIDPHIPLGRVHESADVLSRMGAAVDARVYPGMGHEINRSELEEARQILTLVNS